MRPLLAPPPPGAGAGLGRAGGFARGHLQCGPARSPLTEGLLTVSPLATPQKWPQD